MFKTLGVYFRKFLRNFPMTKDNLVRIQDGPNKGLLYAVALGDDYIYGTYEIDSIDYMLSKISKNEVLFDVGANAGYISMALAQYCKKVYAFEPMPFNINRMQKHFLANKLNSQIDILPYAITDVDKELEFTFSKSHLSNTYIKSSSLYDENQTEKVIGRSIDSLVFESNLEKPKILKIDVEGAEYDVLLGAQNTIQKYSPIIMLATHDAHLEGVKDKCLHFLNGLGYTCDSTKEKKVVSGLEDFICYLK